MSGESSLFASLAAALGTPDSSVSFGAHDARDLIGILLRESFGRVSVRVLSDAEAQSARDPLVVDDAALLGARETVLSYVQLQLAATECACACLAALRDLSAAGSSEARQAATWTLMERGVDLGARLLRIAREESVAAPPQSLLGMLAVFASARAALLEHSPPFLDLVAAATLGEPAAVTCGELAPSAASGRASSSPPDPSSILRTLAQLDAAAAALPLEQRCGGLAQSLADLASRALELRMRALSSTSAAAAPEAAIAALSRSTAQLRSCVRGSAESRYIVRDALRRLLGGVPEGAAATTALAAAPPPPPPPLSKLLLFALHSIEAALSGGAPSSDGFDRRSAAAIEAVARDSGSGGDEGESPGDDGGSDASSVDGGGRAIRASGNAWNFERAATAAAALGSWGGGAARALMWREAVSESREVPPLPPAAAAVRASPWASSIVNALLAACSSSAAPSCPPAPPAVLAALCAPFRRLVADMSALAAELEEAAAAAAEEEEDARSRATEDAAAAVEEILSRALPAAIVQRSALSLTPPLLRLLGFRADAAANEGDEGETPAALLRADSGTDAAITAKALEVDSALSAAAADALAFCAAAAPLPPADAAERAPSSRSSAGDILAPLREFICHRMPHLLAAGSARALAQLADAAAALRCAAVAADAAAAAAAPLSSDAAAVLTGERAVARALQRCDEQWWALQALVRIFRRALAVAALPSLRGPPSAAGVTWAGIAAEGLRAAEDAASALSSNTAACAAGALQHLASSIADGLVQAVEAAVAANASAGRVGQRSGGGSAARRRERREGGSRRSARARPALAASEPAPARERERAPADADAADADAAESRVSGGRGWRGFAPLAAFAAVPEAFVGLLTSTANELARELRDESGGRQGARPLSRDRSRSPNARGDGGGEGRGAQSDEGSGGESVSGSSVDSNGDGGAESSAAQGAEPACAADTGAAASVVAPPLPLSWPHTQRALETTLLGAAALRGPPLVERRFVVAACLDSALLPLCRAAVACIARSDAAQRRASESGSRGPLADALLPAAAAVRGLLLRLPQLLAPDSAGALDGSLYVAVSLALLPRLPA